MKNVNMALCSAVFCAVGAAGSELIGSQLFRSQLRCPVRSNHVEAGRMRLCLHDPAKLPSLVCSAPSGSIPSTPELQRHRNTNKERKQRRPAR